MNHIFDTNILLESPTIIEEYDNVIFPSAILEEIDGLKNSTSVGYKARKANRVIEKNIEELSFDVKDYYEDMPCGWDIDKRDNKIVMCAKENNAILFSNDVNVRIKAKSVDVECYSVGEEYCDEIYKGYQRLSGDTDFINKLFVDISEGRNEYGFVVNEYLILDNTDLGKTKEFRFNGTKFTDIKLPSSRVIKGLNPEQRCALDLLNDKNVAINAILGEFGSGKTYLSLRMALHHVKENGNYSKILAVREPISEGQQIGYLKGSFDEKTEHFFKPLEQCLDGGDQEITFLMGQGSLEKNIPHFMKGTTYHNTIMVVDEAEDLSQKQLQMIGTRLGENSAITFCGDYKQAVKMANVNNPLVQMCKKLKGDPNFGCIVLPEDVRSSISKIFARLW